MNLTGRKRELYETRPDYRAHFDKLVLLGVMRENGSYTGIRYISGVVLPSKKRDFPHLKFFRSLGKFIVALLRHVVHGLPTASLNDQWDRWLTCTPCEWNEDGRCVRCTCKTARPGEPVLLNKLRWAKESCPLPDPKWGPVKGVTVGRRILELVLRRHHRARSGG
jgi:hypothetical protein